MEVELKIDVCDNCKELKFYDKTGLYSPSNNPHGYGVNTLENITNIVSAVLKIVYPDGSISEIDLKNEDEPFPTVNVDIPHIIEKIFPSGVYLFDYTVVFDDKNTIKTRRVAKYFLLKCLTQCCIDKMISSLTINDCVECVNGLKQDQTLKIVINKADNIYLVSYYADLLKSAQFAIENNLPDEAKSIMTFLDSACKIFNSKPERKKCLTC